VEDAHLCKERHPLLAIMLAIAHQPPTRHKWYVLRNADGYCASAIRHHLTRPAKVIADDNDLDGGRRKGRQAAQTPLDFQVRDRLQMTQLNVTPIEDVSLARAAGVDGDCRRECKAQARVELSDRQSGCF
jgi:hypothetical protein